MPFKILNKYQNSTNKFNEDLSSATLEIPNAEISLTNKRNLSDPLVKGKISTLFKYLNETTIEPKTTDSNELDKSVNSENIIIITEEAKDIEEAIVVDEEALLAEEIEDDKKEVIAEYNEDTF